MNISPLSFEHPILLVDDELGMLGRGSIGLDDEAPAVEIMSHAQQLSFLNVHKTVIPAGFKRESREEKPGFPLEACGNDE